MPDPERKTVEGIVCDYLVDGCTYSVGISSEAACRFDRDGSAHWDETSDGRELLQDVLATFQGRAVRVTIETLSEPWGKLRYDTWGNIVQGAPDA